MNDIPIAVISGASLGAPRRGRYATRSIVALISPHATIATISEPTIAPIIGPVDGCAERLKTEEIIVAEKIPTSMKTSPCASVDRTDEDRKSTRLNTSHQIH